MLFRSGIESGINSAKSEAAAGDAALDAKITTAQNAADTAQVTAETHKNYVFGKYTGTGANQYIQLGFKPSAVLISKIYISSLTDVACGSCNFFLPEGSSGIITFGENGFTLIKPFTTYPRYNDKGDTYFYVALR